MGVLVEPVRSTMGVPSDLVVLGVDRVTEVEEEVQGLNELAEGSNEE